MITHAHPSAGDTRPHIEHGAAHSPGHTAATVSIVNTTPEHVRALEKLQQIVFPTLAPEELFSAQKYLKHVELFPEGQFTAIAHVGGRDIVVGATSTFRTDFDFDDIEHTYIEAIAGGWLTNHDPHGAWLYGVDVSVHPQFRGMKIARKFYEARRDLVIRLNMRGEIAGALLPGYALHSEHLSIAQYTLHVKQGRLQDPTLSVQLKMGFEVRGILYDHISDPRSDNAAALIVRENPHYRAAGIARPA
ncbi:MAG: GNAT family N-acetyltransferase [bacterium]|nr:GNAT family N-acetyltransferase [bacterium]